LSTGFHGPEVVGPAGHFRLLVEVAVEQHAVVALAVDLHEDQRRAAFQAHHLHLHALDRLLARPVGEHVGRQVHVPVLLPVGVEHRRLVRDADVFDELRDDVAVPGLADHAVGFAGVHAGNLGDKPRF
jgi:hypothetical protein